MTLISLIPLIVSGNLPQAQLALLNGKPLPPPPPNPKEVK